MENEYKMVSKEQKKSGQARENHEIEQEAEETMQGIKQFWRPKIK